MSSSLDQLLREASELLGCATVAIRCDCANLETVYAQREGERVFITDRGETYGYLTRGDDATFDPRLVTRDEGQAICHRHDVELYVADDVALLPHIRREVTTTDDIPVLVANIAEAIDEIFRASRRPPVS